MNFEKREHNALDSSWLQTVAVVSALVLTAAGTLVATTLWIDSSNQRIAILEEEHREDVQAIAALTFSLRDVNSKMDIINTTANDLTTAMKLVAQRLDERHGR